MKKFKILLMSLAITLSFNMIHTFPNNLVSNSTNSNKDYGISISTYSDEFSPEVKSGHN